MCGRFVLHETLKSLQKHFPIDKAVCEVDANYNVAPTQEIPVIIQDEVINILDRYHWGLVPFWADNIKIGNRMINARVETIEEKPAFRNAFKKRRCLIPANGFYEWKGKKGQKQPMYITQSSSKPFAFAGLWEIWDKKNNEGAAYKSCTILTMASSESVSDIHIRMPVILKADSYRIWLDQKNQDVKNLNHILQDGIITELLNYPVSKRVNSIQNNNPSNIELLDQCG